MRELATMIDAARAQISVTANAALVMLNWRIGHRVRTEVLEGRRAEYGAQIVATLSRQLESRFGRGFNEKSLCRRRARHGPRPHCATKIRDNVSEFSNEREP
jgi:hypothetical protein